jgi:hypothetical protein
MKKLLLTGVIAGILGYFPTLNPALADSNHAAPRADSHAPIGVMGDHMHKAGKFMLSARAMRMNMEGNRIGTNSVSAETIATTVPNRFAGTPMQPPTLRVVPTEMTTDMVMIGGMYAPTDEVTLMLMANYIDREMDHITFQGGAGTTQLGTFKTRTKGLGDTKASALIRLYDDSMHHIHLNAGLSLPTGSIKETDTVLAPNGMTPELRLPYAMQLGSGTFDLNPGVTYTGKHNKMGWGAQYTGTFRLGENSQNYSLGDKHSLSTWGSYLVTPAISASVRITGETESKIDGIDDQIIAPVQTANPDNYGGQRLSLSLGLNSVIPNGALKGHRFSVEATLPVYQDLNGPQMERDNAVIVGWSKAF